jgi:hypothetical protein
MNQKQEIMESYWCMKKNSIIDMMKVKKLDLALTPCLKSECGRWRGGECIQIRKSAFHSLLDDNENTKRPVLDWK